MKWFKQAKLKFKIKKKSKRVSKELVQIPASFNTRQALVNADDQYSHKVFMDSKQYILSKYLTLFTVLFCALAICVTLVCAPRIIRIYYSNKVTYTKWALLLSLISPQQQQLPLLSGTFSLGTIFSLYKWLVWFI
ncbi:uncharacterized protein GVI51_G01265 [Nakaseomyces glabratus]|uniref:Uncharacterized protein n=1 Tax=Candida glabrata (strain ATCC 2001 / BCRC 20586 / JCM 3761 / NBRC 0622 / NRRL Y-65 / CBS 138) TaxID=284593 RepID=Q6FTM1_CANGA|nr:uncharacterized protein CAGL0G01408g [Nakaseomyces glabratus]KAH7586726.1 hypothetical protein J7298_01684 [Nakaseomyces glabratus]KAH7588726.1 hypothetical protein J7297_01678 [Nakaseomyces glabratus]KAH7593140.1 hypothetical protein J7296_01680 [Nakaseomyces glabratus]KAH7602176.1 hypothetical protein J7295_01691 [Nakaseomyces glabratus]KAH7603176.1 hypothetical protein J7294_01676 [Nakaseomyces glabratus]|eukprot:XP_446423.1 uncharacterized protein CAGL0G01408g [[Candida] glabrata]